MNFPSRGRILVTGGAGFIGSALVAELNLRGVSQIVVTDFLGQDERWRNLVSLQFADYIEANVFRTRIQQNAQAFGDFSTVFHLGACSATTEKNAAYLIDNNYEYTKELAHWAITKGCRFIYASSAATYGDGSKGMDDGHDQLDSLRPLNVYGYSKHLFDLYASKHGILDRIVGLKYFNVFGPNEDHKGDMRSLVNKAYHQIVQAGKIELFRSYNRTYQDGEQMRDFLYVKDAVAATLYFADEGRKSNGIYNVGSGEANTWKRLAAAIFDALGRRPQIEFIDMPVSLKEKYQYYTRADVRKLRQAGFKSEMTPLTDAVNDYVQNYLVPGRKLRE